MKTSQEINNNSPSRGLPVGGYSELVSVLKDCLPGKSSTSFKKIGRSEQSPFFSGRNKFGMTKKYSGFTLVELIVVITILVILGTIAFLNLGGFQSNARDSRRVSD
ncbi:MAG: type II secretion system protein, partial [Candidatus Gracilibacteria bacterium]